MVLNSFPRLIGTVVNLRQLSMNDAQAIADLMNYNISKNLYEVPEPYLAAVYEMVFEERHLP